MRREDLQATLIVGAGLAAAGLTGYAREAGLAYQLGVGPATDAYLVAFTLPEFVFTALPIVLVPAFLPLFSDARVRCGEAEAWRFGARVAWGLLGLLVALSLAVGCGAPYLVGWLAPGFGAAQRAEAAGALARMLAALGLMGGATLAGAVLQAYRRFARPAVATALYNLAFVAVLMGLPLASRVDRAAWGVTLGAAAALAVQLPLLSAHRPRLESEPVSGGAEPVSLAAFCRLAGPIAAGYAAHHAIYFVDRAMASTLGAGSVAALNYAFRVALIGGQLSGLSVATALFPRMAEQASRDDLAGLRSSLAAALRFVWVVGLPLCGGLIVLRSPLVQVLFERGAFGPGATAAVGELLGWYSLAMFSDALCQPLWRIVYARRRAWTVLAVNGIQTSVRILANVELIRRMGYSGLAVSAALGLTLQVVLLGFLARRSLGRYLPTEWWQSALYTVAAAGLGILAVWGWVTVVDLPPLAQVVSGGALGALIYGALLRLRGKVL